MLPVVFDLIQQGFVDLSKVEMFVLDSDRMLDMGFIRDIRKVITAGTPTEFIVLSYFSKIKS